MSLAFSFIILAVSLGSILVAASLFTNGIEWLGKQLKLSEGAVGSVLAAVGTALPESMIPVVAIIGGHTDSDHVGIGAILGAPFMLATLAFFVVGLSALGFKQRRQGPLLDIDTTIFHRDLRFFLTLFSVAIAASFIPWQGLRYVIAVLLTILYVIYVVRTVQDGKNMGQEEKHLKRLLFARKSDSPSLWIIFLQIIFSLGLMVGGARYFVNALIDIAQSLAISALLLSLLITPVATELPEKFNSVIWIRKGKDTLAIGNITGAMVFQSSLVPAIGISFTSWELSLTALISVLLALVSALFVYIYSIRKQKLSATVLMISGGFYLLFIAYVLIGSQLNWPVG